MALVFKPCEPEQWIVAKPGGILRPVEEDVAARNGKSSRLKPRAPRNLWKRTLGAKVSLWVVAGFLPIAGVPDFLRLTNRACVKVCRKLRQAVERRLKLNLNRNFPMNYVQLTALLVYAISTTAVADHESNHTITKFEDGYRIGVVAQHEPLLTPASLTSGYHFLEPNVTVGFGTGDGLERAYFILMEVVLVGQTEDGIRLESQTRYRACQMSAICTLHSDEVIANAQFFMKSEQTGVLRVVDATIVGARVTGKVIKSHSYQSRTFLEGTATSGDVRLGSVVSE